MSGYSLLFPGKVYFGEGSLQTLLKVRLPGRRGLVVTGKKSMQKSGTLGKVAGYLKETGKDVFIFDSVEPEVSVETVDECSKFAAAKKADFIIGLGGGSALDCAKAAAGIFRTGKSVKEYLDNSFAVEEKGAFFAAVPSTAGTGSEVTKNSVLTYTEKRIKISLRGDALTADLVICDPAITVSMSPEVTACTGMDALSHAVESLLSTGANSFTRALSHQAITMILKNLPLAQKKPADIKARSAMLEASLLAGFAFANGGLGAVHGIGHPVGAVCKIPHGMVNAILLPYVVDFNAAGNKKIRALAKNIRALNKKLGLPQRLSAACADVHQHILAILKTMVYKSGSMAYNPVKMDEVKVKKILEKAI